MAKRKTPVNTITDYRQFYICSTCGKAFYIPLADDWVYQRQSQKGKAYKRHWFCSWGCMRKWDAAQGRKVNG